MSKKVIGLTGNIASGKSAVTSYLIKLGYLVIDTDKITQDIYENDSFFKEQMQLLFSESIIKNSRIDKKAVAKIVFNDPIKMQQLNMLIHPLIKEKTIAVINDNDGLIFVDAPLLFEAGFADIVEQTIVVVASEKVRLSRIKERDKLSDEEAMNRIKSQMSQEEKIKKSQFIIYNDTSFEELYHQVDDILNKILSI
ncbi:dephospho-CoA kinase [Erysipelotrichaceae bacterium OttesenSCG-928-M19]|nr:dephospho-CoA kinase [Erysipelotrichaceae bacterium OttesenSCG-928-M19]